MQLVANQEILRFGTFLDWVWSVHQRLNFKISRFVIMLVGIVALVAAIQASTSVAKLTLAMATVKAVGRSRT
jgi:hypothetical protein